jgi:hypothetical protein
LDENRTETTEEPRNPHVHHEPGDVNAVFLTKFGIGMGFVIIVFLFMLWGLFQYFAKREAELGPPPSKGVGVTAQKLPPEPRLQVSPSLDMRQMRAAEDQILHQYAWIDPDKGIVRIPVDRAMDLMAQKGFPVLPQAQVPPDSTGKPLGIEAAGGAPNRIQSTEGSENKQ